MRARASLLVSWLVLAALATRAAPSIDIGSRRELFLDRLLIDRLDGVELRLHHPTPAGTALRLDQPWEGMVSGYVTVIKDASRYLMYYRGRPSPGGDGSAEAHEVACYAESPDGILWTRPDLGLFEVSGTRHNNVIMVEPKTVTHNLAPFLDTRPDVPSAERFKALGGTGAAGLFGFISSDGIHWKPASEKALITEGAFDSQNIGFWSASEQSYLCYFRTARNGVRWVARATSPDFLTWTKPTEMGFGDAPAEHIYINQTQPYFRAPHIYVATAARFNPGRRALTEEQAREIDIENPRNYDGLKNDDSDAVLMSSRGGTSYERTFLESFIRPGTDPRNWVARANYPALGVVPTGPEEMSLYVGRHYGQPSIFIERMTLRIDGFASVHAPYRPGEVVTKPLQFAGQELEVNLATSAAGFLRVEIQDAEGKPVPGFAAADCPEIIGDSIARTVRWTNGANVGALAGRALRLRFVLKDADLYSFRFSHPAPGPSSSPGSTLRKMLGIAWKKGPNLPQGFQDSDGGIVRNTLITVGGFCGGQTTVPGKPSNYPRGFLTKAWGLDLGDPAKSWQSLPELPGPARQELFAIAISDQLYCWGGFSYTTPFCYGDGYRLSAQQGRWSWDPLPPLPSVACSAGIAAIGTRIYVMGGADYDESRFYTASDRAGQNKRLGARLLAIDTQDLAAGWKELPACPGTPRFVHATASVRGKLYVIGGGTGNDNPSGQYCTVVDNWCFDPANGRWQPLPDSPVATGNFPSGAITFQDRYILLVGGYQYPKILNPDGSVRAPYGSVTKHDPKNAYNSDVLVFDTETGTFGVADALPLCNNLPMAVLAGDTLHLIGGETGGSVIEGEQFGHHSDLYLVGRIQAAGVE